MYVVVEDPSRDFARGGQEEGRGEGSRDADWYAVQERVQEEYGRAVVLKSWGCWSAIGFEGDDLMFSIILTVGSTYIIERTA